MRSTFRGLICLFVFASFVMQSLVFFTPRQADASDKWAIEQSEETDTSEKENENETEDLEDDWFYPHHSPMLTESSSTHAHNKYYLNYETVVIPSSTPPPESILI
jgi:hypothetical protein